MTDEAIPGIDPVEPPLLEPDEWIEATGRVRYRQHRGSERCDDCLHVTVQFLGGKQFSRPPGLARRAVAERVQASHLAYICKGTTNPEQQGRSDMPETQQHINAVAQVRNALQLHGFTVVSVLHHGEMALQFTGLKYDGEPDQDYIVTVSPAPKLLSQGEQRRKRVIETLIASDGQVRSEKDGVIHFGAFNSMAAQRIKNRAIYQGETVEWGAKFTGSVAL